MSETDENWVNYEKVQNSYLTKVEVSFWIIMICFFIQILTVIITNTTNITLGLGVFIVPTISMLACIYSCVYTYKSKKLYNNFVSNYVIPLIRMRIKENDDLNNTTEKECNNDNCNC